MEEQPDTSKPAVDAAAKKRGFPDPSIWLIEFGEGLGVLLSAVTERDVENRRIVLRKVAYVRIENDGWGVTALPELHVTQEAGAFRVVEPRSGKVLAEPNKMAYEMAFLTKDIFECTINCIKEKSVEPIYELVIVSFGARKGFAVEDGGLTAPEDYATARDLISDEERYPYPPRIKA